MLTHVGAHAREAVRADVAPATRDHQHPAAAQTAQAGALAQAPAPAYPPLVPVSCPVCGWLVSLAVAGQAAPRTCVLCSRTRTSLAYRELGE